jgi:hypothetical protein
MNFSLENSPLFLYLNLDRNIIINYQRYEKKVNVVNDSQMTDISMLQGHIRR